MKKLLVTIIVLALILLGLDRGGVYGASQVLASQIQKKQGLQSKPSVDIHGFPFLTQVVGGKYTEVDIAAKGITANGLRISEVDVQAMGIHVALSDAIHGKVKDVPVDHATGTVHLAYADINALLAARADDIPSVSYDAAGRVTVRGKLSAFGVTANAAVSADVSVQADVVHVTPIADSLDSLPAVLRPLARSALTFSFPLTGLPFGIHLVSGVVTPDGVVLSAEVTGAVFPTGQT